MKTLDMCFKFILNDDDTYLSSIDKLIVREWIMTNYHINGDLTISDDLVVDCSGDVSAINEKVESLTNGLFRWGEVGGVFYCDHCVNLKSLKGAPKIVGESFYCDGCDKLTSLEGAPEKVGKSFGCSGCSGLTTLKGAPKKTDNGFYCNGCENLTSLEGAPEEVGWSFVCSYCKNLTSLEGAPEKVGRLFDCDNCPNLKITDSDREKYKLHKYSAYIPQITNENIRYVL